MECQSTSAIWTRCQESAITGPVTDVPPIIAGTTSAWVIPRRSQKAFLERIITASSNEGDVVLDPFCGCGTTVAVAERLKRRWIGIDITHLAIALMRRRLQDTFQSQLAPYEVIGQPKDLSSAQALAEQNRHQFEWWAVDMVDAHLAHDKRKGADSGIDGVFRFFRRQLRAGEARGRTGQERRRQRVADTDLKGVLEREGGDWCLRHTEQPTRPMVQEAGAGLRARIVP